jgi:hypothetical protein
MRACGSKSGVKTDPKIAIFLNGFPSFANGFPISLMAFFNAILLSLTAF